MADLFKDVFDHIGLQNDVFEAKFAEINAINECKAEISGRVNPLQRLPTEEETQAIEWIQRVQQLDHPNRNWTNNEFIDILNRTGHAFQIVMVEAINAKLSFIRDVTYAYARNCLNSDESGPQLHRDMYQSHFQTSDTDLTYHISHLHTLARNVVRLSPGVVDWFRTDFGETFLKLTAPQQNIDFYGYLEMILSLQWYWNQVLPLNYTWHHVVTVLMVASDAVCRLFKNVPQEDARVKGQLFLDMSAIVVSSFLMEPNNWALLRTMNLEEIPESFIAPGLIEMDEDTRQELLNVVQPCQLIKGVCARPCPKLIDLAISAFPGETIGDKQAFYESNKPAMSTQPIFI